MNTRMRWIVFVICITISGKAHVSRIHYNDVSFSDLNAKAPVVLVVEKKDNEYKEHSIEVVKDGKTYPPFTYFSNKFVVLEVLRGDKIKKDDVIDVYPANLGSKLHMHTLYVVDGIMKSPIFMRYKPIHDLKDRKSFIIFLARTNKDELAYYCINSVEGIELKNKISPTLNNKDIENE